MDAYRAASDDLAALIPAACADTPTHANPSRTSSVCVMTQSGPASMPPDTLSHSTTTVPLNFLGSVGRLTRSRVVYGCGSLGVTVQRPSLVNGSADEYFCAVPE